jgi:KEOPS complex subunit Cgi121
VAYKGKKRMIERKIEGWHVVFAGFKSVKLPDMEVFLERIRKETPDCQVQVFDAKMIGGFDHLYFSVLNALKAFDSGNRISDTLAMEVLLYASGQHQIDKAIRLIGVKPDSSQIVVVALSRSRDAAVEAMNKISEIIRGEQCDDVIELTDEKFQKIKSAFNVSDAELEATLRRTRTEALTSILVERSALLVTQI